MDAFVAVSPDSHFPIQNLPYGVFRPRSGGVPRIGVAIGAWVLDLTALEAQGLLDDVAWRGQRPFAQPTLNTFMGLGRTAWTAARSKIQHLLRADVPTLRDDAVLRTRALIPQQDVVMLLPANIGDYTDFYASKQHAVNVGTMFRGAAQALHPNWVHLPVGYHGRASSVVVSSTDIVRPRGQVKPGEGVPHLRPTRLLDFEMEIGFFVGPGNALGVPIDMSEATDHIFGVVLLNDWSARDIQAWEYVPLGPFLGKSFATSISPWVVSLDALEPFRCAAPIQEPQPLPYLRTPQDAAYDIQLEVGLQSNQGAAPHRVCRTNARHLYWTMPQQLVHHTSNGCNVRPGDLMGSGTISGPTKESYGSLLERSWRGTQPLHLPGGETRTFLEDGDRVTMTGWCQGDGYRIGFGEVTARVLPARE